MSPKKSLSDSAASWYDSKSRGTKRGVVGGTTMGMNVFLAYFVHHALGYEVPPEVIAAGAGLVAGTVAWVFGGGLEESIVHYYEFRKKLRSLRGD